VLLHRGDGLPLEITSRRRILRGRGASLGGTDSAPDRGASKKHADHDRPYRRALRAQDPVRTFARSSLNRVSPIAGRPRAVPWATLEIEYIPVNSNDRLIHGARMGATVFTEGPYRF